MDWVPMHVATVRSPEMAAAPAEAVAAWVRLYAAAAAAENGGRYDGARSWSDRQWMTIASVTAAEVATAVEYALATWDGDTLLVRDYPADAETRARSRSQHASKAARDRWAKDAGITPGITPGNAPSITPGNAEDRTGEERTGEDRTGEDCAEPTADGPALAPPEPPLLVFPCAGKVKTWALTESIRAELAEAYPGVEVMAVARKALEWCRANPKKIKTAKRMRHWIGSVWCGGDQDRGGRQGPTRDVRVGRAPAEGMDHSVVGELRI